ncbi:MAG: hypothetical protein AAF791_04480 [Bacteroidota bacterium]
MPEIAYPITAVVVALLALAFFAFALFGEGAWMKRRRVASAALATVLLFVAVLLGNAPGWLSP